MSEESVIYAALISGLGAIVIVIVKHWRASKCWTKNECCSCNLYREPASPDSNPLDTNNVTFKVDLDITDDNDIKDDIKDDIDVNNDVNIIKETIINISTKPNRRRYLSPIDEEHIPSTSHKIEIQEADSPLENISQV